jgi:hypothetical protein
MWSVHQTHLTAGTEFEVMEWDSSLTLTDWTLSLFVAAIVIGWQLFAGNSFSSKIAGALTFGGVVLGVCLYVSEWYRER